MSKYVAVLILIFILTSAGHDAVAESHVSSKAAAKTTRKSPVSGPVITGLGEYYSNSSEFKRKSIGSEFEIDMNGNVHARAGYTLTEFSQDGFENVTRNRVSLEVKKQLTENTGVLAQVSANIYDTDQSNFNGGLFFRYRARTNLFTELSFRHFDNIDYVLPFHNAIYSYVVTIGSIDLNIQRDEYKVYAAYYPQEKTSFAGEITYGQYSDGNEKRSLMFEAGYKLNSSPHIRTAYNYFYIDFSDPAPLTRSGTPNESAYWDPVDFDTHTLRVEYSDEIQTSFTLGAEGALSYSFDSEGISSTVFLYVMYRIKEHASLRCDARWFHQDNGIDRVGKADRFRAEHYVLMVQHRF